MVTKYIKFKGSIKPKGLTLATDAKLKQLKNVKPKDAINHPRWKMGKKISVDSSTLMNKILEIIEAEKLFNIPNNQLEILIHPESLVHAILKLKNGLTKFINL